MRILLDNCVHRRTAALIPGHAVRHASEMGWQTLRNGQLLATAAAEFDLLITTDKNQRYQQNLERLPLSVLELNTPDTRLHALKGFAPHLPAALALTERFRFVSLRLDGTTETLSPRTP